jgi:hypothetical protein
MHRDLAEREAENGMGERFATDFVRASSIDEDRRSVRAMFTVGFNRARVVSDLSESLNYPIMQLD